MKKFSGFPRSLKIWSRGLQIFLFCSFIKIGKMQDEFSTTIFEFEFLGPRREIILNIVEKEYTLFCLNFLLFLFGFFCFLLKVSLPNLKMITVEFLFNNTSLVTLCDRNSDRNSSIMFLIYNLIIDLLTFYILKSKIDKIAHKIHYWIKIYDCFA